MSNDREGGKNEEEEERPTTMDMELLPSNMIQKKENKNGPNEPNESDSGSWGVGASIKIDRYDNAEEGEEEMSRSLDHGESEGLPSPAPPGSERMEDPVAV